MHVHCPHCHNPIEIVDDSSFREIPCPTCGSSFSLVDDIDATETLRGISRTIAHFELIEQLGIGAFGTVWKANDTKLDRVVAVKIPRKDQLTEAESEQFLREARAASQIKHPNVVSVYEVGRDGDSMFIVSEFVDGLTLSDWLTGQQPTVRTAVELCVKIADALHAAHEQGVVHRDLKPSNVILDRDNEPHVMDFGLAKREAGEITMRFADEKYIFIFKDEYRDEVLQTLGRFAVSDRRGGRPVHRTLPPRQPGHADRSRSD